METVATNLEEGTKAVVGEGGKTKPEEAASAAAVAVAAADGLFPDEDAEIAKVEAAVKAETDQAAKDALLAAEAKAKAEAEAKAKAEAAAKATTEGTTPAAGATGTPAAKPTHDPKDAAIVALRKTLGETNRRNAELVGENRVLRERQTATTTEAPATGTKEEVVDVDDMTKEEIDTAMVDLAVRYDDGKLETAEYKRQELLLHDARARLVVAENLPPPAEDTTMRDHADKLLKDYPILKLLSHNHLDPFYEAAKAAAEAEGNPIPATNRGTMDLRERMAKLAQAHYGKELGLPPVTKDQPGPAAGTTAAPKPGELSPEAIAREEKLRLAAKHPPDIATIGSGAAAGSASEASLMQQLAALGGDEEAQQRLLDANASFVKPLLKGVTH